MEDSERERGKLGCPALKKMPYFLSLPRSLPAARITFHLLFCIIFPRVFFIRFFPTGLQSFPPDIHVVTSDVFFRQMTMRRKKGMEIQSKDLRRTLLHTHLSKKNREPDRSQEERQTNSFFLNSHFSYKKKDNFVPNYISIIFSPAYLLHPMEHFERCLERSFEMMYWKVGAH